MKDIEQFKSQTTQYFMSAVIIASPTPGVQRRGQTVATDTWWWSATAAEMRGWCQDVAGGRIQKSLACLSLVLSINQLSPFHLNHINKDKWQNHHH